MNKEISPLVDVLNETGRKFASISKFNVNSFGMENAGDGDSLQRVLCGGDRHKLKCVMGESLAVVSCWSVLWRRGGGQDDRERYRECTSRTMSKISGDSREPFEKVTFE
jgi:hypothetical protein